MTGPDQPLRGLTVIDCSWGTAGPRATGFLADYGAEVVRVEPPGGDPFGPHLAEAYSVFNRGKRAVELDLKTEPGRDALVRLLEPADVLVQSWRPGVAGRLGLDFDRVHAVAPQLVQCTITGFGLDGPHRDLPGYEAVVHAVVGTMGEQIGFREGPVYEGLPFASIGAAGLALIGILAALYRRGEDGTGRHVETSLLDGALAFLSMVWGDNGDGGERMAVGSHRLVARTFLCEGDEYLGVHTGSVGGFGRLMAVLGVDDRIASSPDGIDMGIPLTAEQRLILDEEVPRIFAARPRSYWEERLRQADVCAVPVLRPGEVFDEPQAVHNAMVVEVDDPVLGPLRQVAPPIRFSAGADPASAGWAWPGPGGPPDERPLLEGVKILDLGAFYAGPYASRLLVDLGAEAIKLEPVAGDPLRGLARCFRSAQAGKRSLAANVKDEAMGPAVRSLIQWADVVHHNMRPGAAERLGIGPADVAGLNPGAIYVYAPGWGSDGPDALRQSFAPLLAGYVGAGFEVGGQHNPPLWPLGNEDPGNGLVGAVAILVALLRRQQEGRGRYVEHPQLNAAMWMMAHVVRRPDGEVLGADRLDPLQTGVHPLDRLYPTSDGWLLLVARRPGELERLAAALGDPALADPAFATGAGRHGREYELGQALAAIIERRSTADLLIDLQAAGITAVEPAPYHNQTFMRDPENQRSGRVAECTRADGTVVRELSVLMRISATKLPAHREAPGLGEHDDEILSWLGYPPDEIAALRERGVIR